MVFGRAEIVLLAINRAAGRRKNHATQAVLARRFHQVEKTDDVHLRVEGGIGDRPAHIHLRRQMHD